MGQGGGPGMPLSSMDHMGGPGGPHDDFLLRGEHGEDGAGMRDASHDPLLLDHDEDDEDDDSDGHGNDTEMVDEGEESLGMLTDEEQDEHGMNLARDGNVSDGGSFSTEMSSTETELLSNPNTSSIPTRNSCE